jgi:formylglycine-generating enzyme required for sulfatase activity
LRVRPYRAQAQATNKIGTSRLVGFAGANASLYVERHLRSSRWADKATGSPGDEPDRLENEDQLSVSIDKPFAVGRFAVTRGEFAAFVAATGHMTDGGCHVHTGSEWKQQADRDWRSPGFSQNDRHPVVCVNWNDAKAYVAWLSTHTSKTYRLLSEAEREYVGRAGTSALSTPASRSHGAGTG